MAKKEDFDSFKNCVNDAPEWKGRWAEFFGNDNPIIIELGCGKGDLSYGLAVQHPGQNHLGVDVKAVRMWTSALLALENEVENVAFLRIDIHGIANYFDENEVDGIWITFPDPFPRKKQTKNRMVHERFLLQYSRILKPGGTIWFKTDNNSYFEYALDHFAELNEKGVFKIEILEQTRDLHASSLKNEENGITTDFERRFLDIGKTINYMSFTLEEGPNSNLVPATEYTSLDPNEKAPKAR